MRKTLRSLRITICIALSFLSIGQTFAQDVTGELEVSVGDLEPYSYFDDEIIVDPNWILSGGGYVSSESQSSLTYTANVKWNTEGDWLLSLYDDNIFIHSWAVKVIPAVPPAPPASTIDGERCGEGSVQLSATLGNGATDIRWYDASNAYLGTGLTYNTPSITTTTTFYAASYNANSELSSTKVQVIATINPPSVDPPVVTGNARFGPGTLSLTAAGDPGTFSWYRSSGTFLTNGASYSDYEYSSSTPYYVILTPSAGCPSLPTWVDVIIEPMPQLTASRSHVALGPVTLTTGSVYSSYEWKKDGITISGTTNTLEVSESGSYIVTVTKANTEGSGNSSPKVITDGPFENQFAGVNGNYIVTNTVLTSGITSEAQVANLPYTSNAQTVKYLDELGMPKQSIATMASPNFKDIVVQYEYDVYGRQHRNYLPFAHETESNGLLKTDPLPTTDRPFSEAVFEDSPLGRVKQSFGPGNDWYNASKSIQQEYSSNDDGIESIIAWELDGSGMPVRASGPVGYVSNGFYTNNQLAISISKDEHGREVRAYTNKKGQLVLKKIQYAESASLSNPSHWLQNYYIYDKYGNLRYELTPTLSEILANSGLDASQAELDKLAFKYTYDIRDRMITSKAPATGPVVMVYDDWDRVVMTQDANQKAAFQWSYTKYDYLSRPVISGIYTHSSDIDQATMTGNIVTANEAYDGTPGTHGYTNTVFPTTGVEALAVTYYDKYEFPAGTGIPTYESLDLPGQQPATAFDRVVGQVVGSKVKVLGTANTYLWGVTYFDDELRPVQTVAQNHLGGYDRITTATNFVGDVTESKITHTTSSGTTTVSKRYNYDHAGRLKQLYHKVGTGPEILLAEYIYNEKGEMAERNLHIPRPVEGGGSFTHDGGRYAHSITLTEYSGEKKIVASQSITLLPGVHIKATGNNNVHLYLNDNEVQTAAQQASNGLQSVDYAYNVRGWLQGINDSSLPTDPEEADDLFGLSINYNTEASSMANPTLFNGNISAIRWSANLGLGATKERGYTFSYDPVNRLTASSYQEKSSSWSATGSFDENGIAYDPNGNITTLQRRGGLNPVDNLTYTYQDTNSDRLAKVSDSADDAEGFIDGTNTGDDYAYDANGNLLQDLNKNIPANGIEYNHLNLPTKITITDLGYFVFTYDATGRKLRQEFFDPSDVSKWHMDYDGAFLYKNDVLQQIAHEEGRYLPNGEYQYVIADHLGSSRVVFTSEPGYETATASMETSNVSEEQGEFLFYDEAVKVNSSIFDHTNQGGTFYSNRLTGTALERTGLAKSLSVMPGDVIKAEVYAKYLDPNSGNWTTALANLINSIANSTAPAGTFIDGGAAGSTGGVAFPFADDLAKGGETGTAPKAYLNYLIFDRNFDPIGDGFVRLTTDAREYGQDAAHERLAVEFTITQPGYVYVFLSNDNVFLGGDPIETYWDDFSVEHIQSPVVQMQDYYPFGLAYNSYLRENTRQDKFLFQGKERIDTLGIYDFHARLYSGELGRFLSVDPKNQFASGYTGMGNSPMMGVDPDGEFVWFAPIIIGAAINVAINAKKGNIDNFWQGLGYAVVGGAAGALSAGLGAGISAGLAGSGFGAGFATAFSGAGTLAQAGIAGASSGFFSGAAIGAGAGFGSGFINSFGNALVGGERFGNSLGMGIRDGVVGGITGGAVGGLSGGISAIKDGRKFWSGATNDPEFNALMKTAYGKQTFADVEHDTWVLNTEHGAALTADGRPVNGKLDVGWVDEIGDRIDLTGRSIDTPAQVHGHRGIGKFSGRPSGMNGDFGALQNVRADINPNIQSYTIGVRGGGIYRVNSSFMSMKAGQLVISFGTSLAKRGTSLLYGAGLTNYYGLFGMF
ncbi:MULTISPECIES: DUF6443 domain-containing protein [unclassified Imperialibacter]|uniref:DUF6443 domain-containing protein n=1 Tax=unclassified Imperialibacter TaxID=2629706 RepID=UPI00125A8177|nr:MULTISPECIES: DUF6443 domain-containing protein [unclassified Imperialibacter]CAD5265061.1 membrane hypothetical protein [Imperialibacter sp. 89]CAD5269953.1 membrane hypothetical protein [Imperialibacter sp. 75]VVT09547.1 membrane hypothetical protein [Imperialibacter sp. EC-SDR9]